MRTSIQETIKVTGVAIATVQKVKNPLVNAKNLSA
jgi:hypothetical protein